mmetsp:Transcript_58946/g.120687  ORF Transcript_58946/g.120687 Transcript_58946/m.120687 type:complete len:126 (-) Transcript_58946:500-877(-)
MDWFKNHMVKRNEDRISRLPPHGNQKLAVISTTESKGTKMTRKKDVVLLLQLHDQLESFPITKLSCLKLPQRMITVDVSRLMGSQPLICQPLANSWSIIWEEQLCANILLPSCWLSDLSEPIAPF